MLAPLLVTGDLTRAVARRPRRVALVRTTDRRRGVHEALALPGVEGVSGTHVVLKAGRVMIAGDDRVAVDAVGLAMLKHLGANQAIMGRRTFEQEQIARAVELKIGAPGPDAIDIVTASDTDSRACADALRAILARG